MKKRTQNKRKKRNTFLRDFKKQSPNIKMATVVVSLIVAVLLMYILAYIVAKRSQHLPKEKKSTHAIVADAIVDIVTPQTGPVVQKLSNADVVKLGGGVTSLLGLGVLSFGFSYFLEFDNINKFYTTSISLLIGFVIFYYLLGSDHLTKNCPYLFKFIDYSYLFLKYSLLTVMFFEYLAYKWIMITPDKRESGDQNPIGGQQLVELGDANNDNNNA